MKKEKKYDSMGTPLLLARLGISSFDSIGIGVSGMCVVHCLFTQAALLTLPFLPFLEAVHHWIHPVLALLIVPVTLVAMWTGFRHHRKVSVLVPLLLGMTIMLTTAWFVNDELNPEIEVELNFLGSGLLIIGHWWNRQTDK